MADDENFLEKQAVEFLEVADFNQVKPTNIEAHFGAMQLSTAISMKRIADVLQQWIDLVTEEDVEPKQDDLDKAYVDGFKAGQRSRNEAILKNEIADDELERIRAVDAVPGDDYGALDDPGDPPEEDEYDDFEDEDTPPSKNQMS